MNRKISHSSQTHISFLFCPSQKLRYKKKSTVCESGQDKAHWHAHTHRNTPSQIYAVCKHSEKNILQKAFYKNLNAHRDTCAPTVVKVIQRGMVAHAEWGSCCRRSLSSLRAESAKESLRMQRGEEEEEWKERRGEKRRRGSRDLPLSLLLDGKGGGGTKRQSNKKKNIGPHIEQKAKLLAIQKKKGFV